MEERKLIMTFKNSLGNSFSLTVYDPKDDLTEEGLAETMSTILNFGLFTPKNATLTEISSAKIIETNTTSLDLDFA